MNELLFLFEISFIDLPLHGPNTQDFELGGAFPEILLIGLFAS